jgi:hypothetical protein
MKGSLITLLVSVSAFVVTDRVYANEVNNSPARTRSSQAALLTIGPVSSTTNAGNTIYSINKLNQLTNSFPPARSQASQPINVFDVLKDPAATLKRLSETQNNQRPESIDPLGFFKVPALDSGTTVTVGRF